MRFCLLWISLISSVLYVKGALVKPTFVAGPAGDYVLFTGAIPVQYVLSSIGSSQSLSIYRDGDNLALAQQSVQRGVREGIVQFSCDTLSTPGDYVIRLVKHGEVVKESAKFTAVWPQFNFSLPSNHIAQEEDHPQLTSRSVNQRVACRHQEDVVNFWLEVAYSEDAKFSTSVVIHKELDITLRKLKSYSQEFRCELFDRAGFYRAVLRASTTDEPLSQSNVMRVRWGDYYQMSSTQSSIFPCENRITIQYTRPACISLTDNIHMYAARPSSMRGKRELEYLYEAKAVKGESSTSFDCAAIRQYQWHNNILSYCFKYQTVASNQAVTDHGLFCLPSNSTVALPIDGDWSTWSFWSECSHTCAMGRQSRFRYCNSPTPTSGGRFCEGKSVEWRECKGACPTKNVLPTRQRTTSERPPHKVPECWCGCTMSSPYGIIIPGRSCSSGDGGKKSHMVWIIKTYEDTIIRLNITEFRWKNAGDVLKVRNGENEDSVLILDLRGNRDFVDQQVVSDGNRLHMEFISRESIPREDLFYATYEMIMKASDVSSPLTIKDEEEEAVWKLPVIIGGSLGGFTLVMIIIGVCAYSRINKSQTPKKPEQSRRRSNHTSPNHVVIQVQDGEYTNFGDVTLASSVQPNSRSHKQHRKKRKERHHHHHVEAISELPEDLPDPYYIRPEDFIHDTNLLHIHQVEGIKKKHTRKHHSKGKKGRRRKHRSGRYDDPAEVDKLLNSLPGAQLQAREFRLSAQGEKDSEYRALINLLSTSSSQNRSEIVNTSAEVHPAPHCTPVSAEVSNSAHSPCLDDGYNSIANTGSTQSNLSAAAAGAARDCQDITKQDRVLKTLTETSPLRRSRISTPITSICNSTAKSQTAELSASDSPGTPTGLYRHTDCSHITCPLPKPDGDSDTSLNYTEDVPSLPEAEELTPESSIAPPPPDSFADWPTDGPKIIFLKNQHKTPSHATTDNYNYDDYVPPPTHGGSVIEVGQASCSSWPQPPTLEVLQSSL